jgi:hypothetical protein
VVEVAARSRFLVAARPEIAGNFIFRSEEYCRNSLLANKLRFSVFPPAEKTGCGQHGFSCSLSM